MKTTIIALAVILTLAFSKLVYMLIGAAICGLSAYIIYRLVRGVVDPEWLAAQEQITVDHSSDLSEED